MNDDLLEQVEDLQDYDGSPHPTLNEAVRVLSKAIAELLREVRDGSK